MPSLTSSTDAPEYRPAFEALSPAFQPQSGATPQTLAFLSSVVEQTAPLAPLTERPSSWEEAMWRIEKGIADIHRKTRFPAELLAVNFTLIEGILKWTSRGVPPPTSYALWALEGLIGHQRSVIESEILEGLERSAGALARRILSKLVSDRNLPIDALFPVGDPREAANSIEAARRLLEGDLLNLDPKIKQIILDQMTRSLGALLAAGTGSVAVETHDPTKLEEAVASAKALAEGAASLVEDRAQSSEKVAGAAKETVEKSEKITANGYLPASDLQRLRELAFDVVKAAEISPSVLAAAVTLGMPERTAEALATGMAAVQNLASAYIGMTTADPYMAIGAVANLVTIIGGGGRTDASAQRHREIMHALETLALQNQAILRNQNVIIRNQNIILDHIRALHRNQATILELSIEGLDAIRLNREFIVRLIQGPLLQLENTIDLIEIRNRGAADGPVHAFEMLRQVFEDEGDVAAVGLPQLELVFQNPDAPHPALLQESYDKTPLVVLENEAGVTHFARDEANSAASAVAETRRLFRKRGRLWVRGDFEKRALSETATVELGLFDRDVLGFSDTGAWDGRLPERIIDVGVLMHLGTIAVRSHYLFQMLSGMTGRLVLRDIDEIRADSLLSDRGANLLQNVLVLINRAIAQRLVLSGRFVLLRLLREMLQGAITPSTYIAASTVLVRDRWIENWYQVLISCRSNLAGSTIEWIARLYDLFGDRQDLDTMIYYLDMPPPPRGYPDKYENEVRWAEGFYDELMMRARQIFDEARFPDGVPEGLPEHITLRLAWQAGDPEWQIEVAGVTIPAEDEESRNLVEELGPGHVRHDGTIRISGFRFPIGGNRNHDDEVAALLPFVRAGKEGSVVFGDAQDDAQDAEGIARALQRIGLYNSTFHDPYGEIVGLRQLTALKYRILTELTGYHTDAADDMFLDNRRWWNASIAMAALNG